MGPSMAVKRKVRPLPKRFQPKEPIPPFAPGDVVTTIFKPLLYHFVEPLVVIRCERSPFCASGWGVVVHTSMGEKTLDSLHFKHDTHHSSVTA